MSFHLPDDLERFVNSKVQSGRFASPDEAIAEAVRMLREHEEAEDARVLAGIREGLEDMHAGRGRPADDVLAEIRQEFHLKQTMPKEAGAISGKNVVREKPARPKKPLSPAELDQYMLSIGLISRLPDPAEDIDDDDVPPINIEGEPLSETIIRERR